LFRAKNFDAIDKDKAIYAADIINDHIKKYSSKSGYQRFGNSANSPNRKYFSEEIKETVLHRQKNRCADCKKLLTIMDFDHINGDRSDNSCQTVKLCVLHATI